jgi:TonB family protein
MRDNGATRDQYFELTALQEARGAVQEAEGTLNAVRQAFPNDPEVLMRVAQLQVKYRRFDRAVQLVEEAAAMNPTDPRGYQLLAGFYHERAANDTSLTEADKRKLVQSGIAATDRALSYNPDYPEAMIYKNIFLRMQANLETDASSQRQLIAEADVLRNRAMELSKMRGQVVRRAGDPPPPPPPPPPGMAPPPPPPPPPPGQEQFVDGLQPLRVGGNIKPPVKLKDVKPAYPPDAMAAKVSGVIILEAVINTSGQVVKARVLRGDPMLNQAAIDAVEQWEFTPTLLNGVPTPIMMTVTVNFQVQ